MEPFIEVIEGKLFSGAVADEIVASIDECVVDRGSCSIALAGGSTPSAVYRDLSKPPRVQEVAWQKVNLFWGDERWVPADNVQSNQKMAKETLLSHLHNSGPKVYGVDTTKKTPEEAAALYSKTIVDILKPSAGEIPVFDLVLLGIGSDGHTASLFPHSPDLSKPGICIATKHTDGSLRVTLTKDVFCNARKIFFIVTGESKAPILQRVIEGNDSIEELPSRFYKDAKGQVTFFLDSGASLKLENRLQRA